MDFVIPVILHDSFIISDSTQAPWSECMRVGIPKCVMKLSWKTSAVVIAVWSLVATASAYFVTPVVSFESYKGTLFIGVRRSRPVPDFIYLVWVCFNAVLAYHMS